MKTTTTVRDIDLEIEFDYTPGHRAVMYPIDRACPEQPPEVEMIGIYLEGMEISALLSQDVIDRCVEAAEEAAYAGDDEERMCAAEAKWEERREMERLGV
jgi:hypothetical protein